MNQKLPLFESRIFLDFQLSTLNKSNRKTYAFRIEITKYLIYANSTL